MSAELTEALKNAKYNELVEVEVSDGETNQRIVLTATLDQENGGTQWINVSDDNLMHRHLRTKKWIFPMLNDHTRNELYEKAIQRACKDVVQRISTREASSTTPTVHALDIGSGTGLLAMLTAKHLKENMKNGDVRVTSLEMSSAMSKIAKRTAEANALADNIGVVEGHSCEIPSLTPKAEICTSELLDSRLLGEGWIPAMRDAWERHLAPGASVVPQGAKVFAQVVESETLSNYWGPYQSTDDLPNQRSLALSTSKNKDDVLLGGGVLVPMHLDSVYHDIKILSDPILAFEIDVSSKDSIPASATHKHERSFIPVANGRAQGVIFWWELNLYGGDLTYTTEYKKSAWQDHWHTCAFVFGKRKEDCLELESGKAMSLVVQNDDTSISFDVANVDEHEQDRKRARLLHSTIMSYISPERAWQLNDLRRTEILKAGLIVALETKGTDAVVLDLSDFSLCAMIAALLGCTHVSSLETSQSHLPEMTARIAQIGNGLPLKDDDGKDNIFQIVRCHAEQLTPEVFGGATVDIVVAEPYYEILEGWHLQEALNYFYTIRGLKKRGLLSEGATSVPVNAKVMVCAFESEDLLSAYSSCETMLCGFGHGVINEHCQFSKHDVSLPTWQYKLNEMTAPLEVAHIDFEKCEINDEVEISSPFKQGGLCSGILLWVEYTVLVRNEKSILSTKNQPSHQVVRILPRPIHIADCRQNISSLSCRASLKDLDRQDGDYLQLKVEQGEIEN